MHDGGYEGDGLTVLPVGELCQVIAKALEEQGVVPNWGENIVELGGTEEGADKAWVEVEVGGREGGASAKTSRKRYEADIVVGCDGGNSGVRRLMFGKNNFPGFTWDEQIVATNVGI